MKCWGYNANGQLGQGDIANRGDAPGEMGDTLPRDPARHRPHRDRQLTAGNYHTCALLDDASVKCWGYGATGRLGLGNTSSRGDNANEMGDSLPAVSLGTGRTATAVSGGDKHTCALLDDRTVKCWGTNTNGQLGLGDVNHRGDAAGEMGNALPRVDVGRLRLIDGVVPTAQATAIPNAWQSLPVVVQLSAQDGGGSGLRPTRYAIFDDGDPTPDPFGVQGQDYDGVTPPRLACDERLVYAAADRWGNHGAEHTTAAARVDADAPQTTDDVPATPQSGPVRVTLDASDDCSGAAEIRYTVGTSPGDPNGPDGNTYDASDKPLLHDGERIRYSATDVAGHVESAHSSSALAVTDPPPAPDPDPDPSPTPDPTPTPTPTPDPTPPATGAGGPNTPGSGQLVANLAPIANAVVTRRTGAHGSASGYRLDAGVSLDPDGRIVRRRWQLDGRTISTKSRMTLQLVARTRPYRVTLAVTDDDGATSTSTVTLRTPSSPRVAVTIPTAWAYATPTTLSNAARRLLRRLHAKVPAAQHVTIAVYAGANVARSVVVRQARAIAALLAQPQSRRHGVSIQRRRTGDPAKRRIVIAIEP